MAQVNTKDFSYTPGRKTWTDSPSELQLIRREGE